MMSDRVTYALENNGLTVELDPIVPRKFLKAAGMTGSGIAPTKLNIKQSVRGGGRFQSSVRLPRDMDLPVTIFGDGRAEIESNLDELINVFQDRFSTPYLVATYPDGTQYDAEFHLSGGADHQWGSSDTDGRNYVKWPLKITCPSPYWTARTPSVFEVKAASGRGLIKTGSGGLSRLELASSQALGQISVQNGGHVDAYPVWTIKGPGTGFTLTRQIDGASLVYNASIGSSEVITIDTREATIENGSGSNLFGNLIGAPKFFTIPPGSSNILVNMPNATSASSVMMMFRERREMIF